MNLHLIHLTYMAWKYVGNPLTCSMYKRRRPWLGAIDAAVWSTSLGYAIMAILNKDNLGCGPVLKQQEVNLHEIDNKFIHAWIQSWSKVQWLGERDKVCSTLMKMTLFTTHRVHACCGHSSTTDSQINSYSESNSSMFTCRNMPVHSIPSGRSLYHIHLPSIVHPSDTSLLRVESRKFLHKNIICLYWQQLQAYILVKSTWKNAGRNWEWEHRSGTCESTKDMIQPRQVQDDTAVQHSSRPDCRQSTHFIACHELSQVIEDFYDLCSLRQCNWCSCQPHCHLLVLIISFWAMSASTFRAPMKGNSSMSWKRQVRVASLKQVCRWHAHNQSLVFIPLSGYVCAWMWLLGQLALLHWRQGHPQHTVTHSILFMGLWRTNQHHNCHLHDSGNDYPHVCLVLHLDKPFFWKCWTTLKVEAEQVVRLCCAIPWCQQSCGRKAPRRTS